jgi:hypothetical protein
MSYNSRTFKKLPPSHASHAARMANAMVKKGVPADEAVKTAHTAGKKSVPDHDPMREGYNKL